MFRLALTLYGLIASTLAATAVVVALVAGATTLGPLLVAAGAGALLAVPVAWVVARRLHGRG